MTKYKVLSTGKLERSLIEQARENNIEIDVVPFIETEAVDALEIYTEIENALMQIATVVFTSANAVEAVAAHLHDYKPGWRIYCIGNTTKKLVGKYFGMDLIAATARDANELAEKIIEDDLTEEVIFFCGDKRRDELPALLNQHDIEVNEIEVYRTKLLQNKIDKGYHGILFFSPSAVISFFKNNSINEETVLFAIGKTTAAEIKKYSVNRVVVSDETEKKFLIGKAIKFFDKNQN